MRLTLRIPEQEQSRFVAFVLSFSATISLWAFLHDLHLMHVEPRHFTEYHRQVFPITNQTLLTLQYALIATLGPSMLFGALAWAASRSGAGIRLELIRTLALWSACLVTVEWIVRLLGKSAVNHYATSGRTLYPEDWYPDLTPGMIYTQTVNISTYLLALLFGTAFLFTILLVRRIADHRIHNSST